MQFGSGFSFCASDLQVLASQEKGNNQVENLALGFRQALCAFLSAVRSQAGLFFEASGTALSWSELKCCSKCVDTQLQKPLNASSLSLLAFCPR